MNIKADTLFIGLGNCGCKITKLFAELGYSAMFANGSEQDLKVLGDQKGIYKLNGYDGFGGHREKAMNCLCDNAEFTNALEDIPQSLIFIVYASGGSTGSGLSSVVAQYILDVYGDNKTICMCPVLPNVKEDTNKLWNGYQVGAELSQMDGIGATFFIDNNSGDNLKQINRTFVKVLNAYLTDDTWSDTNNFDEAERMELLREQGAMIISQSDRQYKILDDLLNNTIFAPIENDKVVGKFGIVHGGKRDISVDMLIAEIGKPFNIFEGYGKNGTMIAISGLTFPYSRIKEIGELAKKAQQERQRNIEARKAHTLPSLDIMEMMQPKKAEAPKPKLTGRDALMAMRSRMAN